MPLKSSSSRPVDPTSDSGATPHNLDTILYLLRRFEKEQQGVQTELATVSASLIAVQVELGHLRKFNENTEKKMEALEQLHVNCPARRDIVAVNARLKLIEKREREELKDRVEKAERIADESSRIDTAKQAAEAAAMVVEKKKSNWSIFATREAILIYLAILLFGIGIGALALGNVLGIIDTDKATTIIQDNKE